MEPPSDQQELFTLEQAPICGPQLPFDEWVKKVWEHLWILYAFQDLEEFVEDRDFFFKHWEMGWPVDRFAIHLAEDDLELEPADYNTARQKLPPPLPFQFDTED